MEVKRKKSIIARPQTVSRLSFTYSITSFSIIPFSLNALRFHSELGRLTNSFEIERIPAVLLSEMSLTLGKPTTLVHTHLLAFGVQLVVFVNDSEFPTVDVD